MRRISLRTLLVAFNVGMVAVALLCVGIAGVTRLRRLADEQAMARVQFAGLSAAQAIGRDAAGLQATARLLAERPTLARLLGRRRAPQIAAPAAADSLRPFIERFRNTGRLAGAAVAADGHLIAASGVALAWSELLAAPQPQGWGYLLPATESGALMLVAWAGVPTLPAARVMTALVLDEIYASDTAQKAGLPVHIHHSAGAARGGSEEQRLLRFRALDTGEPAAARASDAGLYVAAVALRDPAGTTYGLVEAELSAAEVDRSLRGLVGTLVLLTIGVGAVALVFGLLLARRIAGPVEALTAAAARIGSGDLETAVPRASGAEVGTLAGAMEEMRERILSLTTEARRRQAEAEAVLAGIVEGVFAVDRERRLRYLNPQAAALLGVDAAQAIGQFCGDVLNPQGRTGVRPCEESCPILHARFRGSARAIEHLLLGSGERRAVVITSAPPGAESAGSAAGDTAQFQVIRDETELEAARRLRDAVLANISHEFRTPLSAQLASLELLRDRLPDLDAAGVQGLVLSIERGTLRLTRLIDNLLESTRIEAGQDSLRRQRVALDEVIEEAVGLMAPLIAQREQILEVDLPYPLPPIEGDGPRLVQVFVNLLANANKFAPAGTTIRIGGEVRPREIALWVADEGPGLPDGAGDALFERFTRSTSDEPEAGGMGLGLFIVRSIVSRHAGRVEADGSDGGTRMRVVLPRRGDDEDTGR